MIDNTPTVLVIGGSVAGAACALRLRQHNIDVVVAERATFPRFKVCGCCIGSAGLALLDELLLGDWARQTGQPTNCWRSSIGGKRIELALPTGVAISRESLDSRMLDAARSAGALVRAPCRASIERIDMDSVTAGLNDAGESQHQPFSVVVIASGLSGGGLQSILPWRQPPSGPFGAAMTVSCDEIEPGVVYMACDADGYVGLVRLESGRVDVAGALVSGSDAALQGTPQQRIESILRRSEFSLDSLMVQTPIATTPPLRRSRLAGSGRVLAIGDAAGYVEPFTGEGMTWAIRSAIEAADLIHANVGDLATLGRQWNRRLRRTLQKKQRACRVVTGALRHSIARRAVAEALTHWPSLANPLIRSLNHAE